MSILAKNGISFTAIREENDYYATDPKAMTELLKYEHFNNNVWECACGEGNLSEVLKEAGYNVFSTDLIDRGYQDELLDFLKNDRKFDGISLRIHRSNIRMNLSKMHLKPFRSETKSLCS